MLPDLDQPEPVLWSQAGWLDRGISPAQRALRVVFVGGFQSIRHKSSFVGPLLYTSPEIRRHIAFMCSD